MLGQLQVAFGFVRPYLTCCQSDRSYSSVLAMAYFVRFTVKWRATAGELLCSLAVVSNPAKHLHYKNSTSLYNIQNLAIAPELNS